jgi:hypothetical protein
MSGVWDDYSGLDVGIRFAVRVLHARGIETCQSCQGGDGHAYDYPTVDLPAPVRGAQGFEAVSLLAQYGLPVQRVALVWDLDDRALPYAVCWRVELREAAPERADAEVGFVFSYEWPESAVDAAGALGTPGDPE